MFAALDEKTHYIFGACNALTISMVWALYPETNQPLSKKSISSSPPTASGTGKWSGISKSRLGAGRIERT
ncbi:MAG: hypothetical protein MMC33_002648 [Icmadophila ericetorum]|nr:hypothetical protein [Icmadophila ericetorum]